VEARTRKRALVGGAAALGAGLLVVLGWWFVRAPRPRPKLGPPLGAAMGALVQAMAEAAPGWRAPALCMEADADAPAAPVRLGDAAQQHATLGVVADARGADEATLARARAAARRFAEAHVDVVLSLGGQGQTRAELESILGALAGPDWLLVALPGDREAIDAHREAVAALAKRGLRVVDGSALGFIVVGGVAVGLVPGAPARDDGYAHGLIAGADGCARTPHQLVALEQRLAAEPGPHVLAAYRPPRQRGLAATDLALGGVHVGEPALAELAAHVGAVAFVHAGVEETGGRAAGTTWTSTSTAVSTMMWRDRLAVSVGPMEALPHPSWSKKIRDLDAIVVEIDHMRARVRAVRTAARNPGTLQ
jgi:hypothetical protein